MKQPVLIVTFLLYASAVNAQSTEVRLKSQAVVAGSVVTLGDVADVLGADPQSIDRLRSIALAPAPAAGRRMRLDFATIRSRLAAQGVNLALVQFSGSSQINVSADGRPAPARHSPAQRVTDSQVQRATQLVADAIRSYLRGKAPQLGDATVSVGLNPEEAALVLTGIASGFHVAGGAPPWDAPQRMTVAFMDRDETLRRVAVICKTTAQPHVLVSLHAIPRGQILSESDLTWARMDVTQAVATRMEDAVGRETKRSIRKGEPIAINAIQSRNLVRSNDIVKTFVRKGSITVESYLKARSSGGLGDAVTLVSLDGRQRISARVTGLHEAEVIGSEPPSGRPAANAPIQLTSGQSEQTGIGRRPHSNAPNRLQGQ